MIMITPHFPKTPAFLRAEFNGANPFRTLPAVEFRHHQSQRPTMVRFEVLAVMAVGQDHIVVQKFADLQVGRVTTVTTHENITRLGFEFRQLHQLADLNSFPAVVVARPGGDAMKIRSLPMHWQLAEFVPTEPERILDEAVQAKIPFGGIEARRRSIAQHWKISDQSLSGWKTLVLLV